MNAMFSRILPRGVLAQRLAGASLVLIAFVLIVFDAVGFSMTPNACSILLLTTLIIIAFAIHNTPGGITSLIGLFYIGTVLWVGSRPLLALITQNDSVYTLLFGQLVEPRGEDLYRLLAFWIIGIASLFGGYFLFFCNARVNLTPLSDKNKIYCKRSFIVAFVIVAVLLPVLLRTRLLAFATNGYLGIYLNQADSSFSLLPILEYLCPALYALAVLIAEKRYSRLAAFALIFYAFSCVIFGQRTQVGTYLFVALWHFSTILGKPVRICRLLLGFAVLGCVFQGVQVLRTGDESGQPILVQFFISQGVMFMLPALSWRLSPPPVHTILGTLVSLRHFYRLLGIGSPETAAFNNYLASQSSPILFETGNGLASSFYLDIFYLCVRRIFLYAVACGLLGCLLRKWEEWASRSSVALFFLCLCLPSIFFVQRASLSSVISSIIYLFLFMAITYLLNLCLTLIESSEDSAERIDVMKSV